MKARLFFLTILSFGLQASYLDYIYGERKPSLNSWGHVGLIQTPTANILGESNAFLSITQNDIYKFGAISVSPFDWMEASYFYYRPNDLYWDFVSPGTKGKYLDKGFSVKFLYEPKSKVLPNVALGLDDFAGTGVFTREYIASTFNTDYFNLTLGLGWGKFAGNNTFSNPIFFLSERPKVSDNYDQGGMVSYDKWFRGDASLFGGIEYYIPKSNGLKLKIELDPYDYYDFACCGGGISEDFKVSRKKDSNINFGLSYQLTNGLQLNLSYIKGNLFNLNWSIGGDFSKPILEKEEFNSKTKINNSVDKNINTFYEDLLINLNNKQLYLQSAEINGEDISIAINTNKYRSSVKAASYTTEVIKDISSNYDLQLKTVSVTRLNGDISLNEIKTKLSQFVPDKKYYKENIFMNTSVTAGSIDALNNKKFTPRVLFPVSSTTVSPGIVNHVGSPEKFYLGSLVLNIKNETQFSRRLILSTEIAYKGWDNYNERRSFTDSPYLPNVRTEILRYLQESDLYIPRMQLDYIWSPKNEIFTKLSAGLFETMFGGIGGEVLYSPFNKRYSIGADFYHVIQRDFDQKFKFKDYKTNTGHLNFYYYLDQLDVISKISYGRYLAKDVGWTFDLSRRTASGFRAGFFFSLTSASSVEFGEGSFDKGFYIQIPLDIFSKKYSTQNANFSLKPLTRDGGAKLAPGMELEGFIFDTKYGDLYKQRYDLYN
jgi:hypothetical protein